MPTARHANRVADPTASIPVAEGEEPWTAEELDEIRDELTGEVARLERAISVAEAGYFKPHWKTYAKAEELIGEDRSSCLFVANHAFDCIGAKSYGMRSAFIDRRRRPFGETPHAADLIVANFAELAAAMKR